MAEPSQSDSLKAFLTFIFYGTFMSEIIKTEAIVIYAAEHGVKAIYAEKALAASLEEANAIAAACAANDVALNMGTNRRYGKCT